MNMHSLFCQSRVYKVVFIALCGAFIGCESLKQGSNRREFQIENSWVRQTTKTEFLGFKRMNRMTPIVLERMVIQSNSIDGITAFDRKSGSEIWRIDLKNGVEGGAQVVGNRIYFGSSNGIFYCANIEDGKTIWTFAVRAETLAQPTVENGIVYFASGADVVYALDAATGKQLWLFNRQVTGSLSIRATTRPVVAGEIILNGFSDGFLVALKKRDGTLLWERKLGKGVRFRDVDATPVVEGQNVYASSFDSGLFSLKLATGEINWSTDEGAFVPVTIGQNHLSDRIFYATATGKLMAVDKNSGKIMMTIPLKSGIATQPALFKNFIVYGESEGALVIADAQTGAALGKYESGQGLISSPTIVESTGEVFFVSNLANLYALKIGYRRASDRLPWRDNL